MRNFKTSTFILIQLILFFLLISLPAYACENNVGCFIVGDGSGGGGGGGGNGSSGGAGGGDNDTISRSSSTATNVIFGDGSGGGAGGRGVGSSVTRGGKGGSGADTMNGGSGNDIIFGDGFDGIGDSGGGFYPGNGGFGGGGGGGGGGGFGSGPNGTKGGLCAGGGGAGSAGGAVATMLVVCDGATNGGGPVSAGGYSAQTTLGLQGPGGAAGGSHSGGGGGFGGGIGGAGGVPPQAGTNGNTDQHMYPDLDGFVYSYVTEAVLRSVFTNYPNFGAGNDTIDGNGGANELIGMGGQDRFIVDSASNATRNRVWDFSGGDKLILQANDVGISLAQTQAALDTVIAGDYDSDGASDDARITYATGNIDLININSANLMAGSGEITITNATPALSIAQSDLTYTPGAAATPIDAAGTVSDADGDAQWNGGTLKIQITSNAEAADTLSLSGTDISIIGDTNLKYAGVYVGLVSSTNGTVTGSTALTITFDSGATNAIVQSILRGLRFATNPAGSIDRIVRITATDLNGASTFKSRTIDVVGAGAIAPIVLSFDTQGGSTVTAISQIEGTNVTLPAAPTRSGYDFVAWNSAANGSGDAYDPGDVMVMPAANSTIYARWTAVSAPQTSGSTPQSSMPAAATCNDTTPDRAPDLFQISMSKESATLFFTPISGISGYYISYSTRATMMEHGVTVQGSSEGVQAFTVKSLLPGTTYSFTVRGQNGCATGPWGNSMQAQTVNSTRATLLPYYRSTIFTQKKLLMQPQLRVAEIVKPAEKTPSIAPVVPATIPPQSIESVQPPQSQKTCFLFWCW